MNRRLVTLAAAVSLLLCVATVALWVRSYSRSDCIVYVGPSGHRGVQWAWGALIIGMDDGGSPRRQLEFISWGPPSAEMRVGSGRWSRLGFGYESVDAPPNVPPAVDAWMSANDQPVARVRVRRLAVPMWCVAALFSVLPIWKLVAIRSRRNRVGVCPSCGYDLRATPDRCPECGAAPAVK